MNKLKTENGTLRAERDALDAELIALNTEVFKQAERLEGDLPLLRIDGVPASSPQDIVRRLGDKAVFLDHQLGRLHRAVARLLSASDPLEAMDARSQLKHELVLDPERYKLAMAELAESFSATDQLHVTLSESDS